MWAAVTGAVIEFELLVAHPVKVAMSATARAGRAKGRVDMLCLTRDMESGQECGLEQEGRDAAFTLR